MLSMLLETTISHYEYYHGHRSGHDAAAYDSMITTMRNTARYGTVTVAAATMTASRLLRLATLVVFHIIMSS